MTVKTAVSIIVLLFINNAKDIFSLYNSVNPKECVKPTSCPSFKLFLITVILILISSLTKTSSKPSVKTSIFKSYVGIASIALLISSICSLVNSLDNILFLDSISNFKNSKKQVGLLLNILLLYLLNKFILLLLKYGNCKNGFKLFCTCEIC